ncbi:MULTISPECIES: class I SAM-dependent DNA methyltransferase [unclassified Streptomyces]|uniref:type I restriction-modification system subunit M n=1 Tax=unclassified Streptomyces TaxID=2593676 RepID=UPI002474FFF4|nr:MULTISPECIES: class I SAM-dependent DNA methyltransferase [unclassified Streptomyces]MDH6451726.1 type I restriction enzyme M protein [Streptomyces sp. SAI-119]MDH6497717.1 type I restriction enzyme M protein [Streptomyces sp. SAI-149]
MPPRKRAAAAAGQGELLSVSSTKEIQDILWKAADKLRGSMDAAQYKEFVLGLVFLKYVSDAFTERREELAADPELAQIPEHRRAAFLEEKDEYTEKNVFWVPPTARWDYISENAASAEGGVGKLLDEAMDEVMKANKTLTGVLPKIFNRDNVDQKRLKELVDLISDARFTGHGDRPAQDVLGETYEYFLEKFARAEGKRAGEFYTPASVVRLIVEVLEPYEGRVYDPACGSGGMFVQSGKFVAKRRGKDHTHDIAVYGQEANERTWRLAKMNLAIHGMDPKGVGDRWADTFADDKLPDLKADFVMANPPFNMSDWARKSDDRRWRYGTPPQSNANYAWLQHIVSKLGDRGSAGVVLSNGSMSSKQSGEGEIRAAMVEADLISCMIVLPGNLFRTTPIPACLWFLAKDKSPQGSKNLSDRRSQVLFIDARALGSLLDRTERILTDGDLEKIADTYHAWRGTESAKKKNLAYSDVAGYCYSASLEEIKKHDYLLTPGLYVGTAEVALDPDAETAGERIVRLKKELFAQLDESARLDAVVREKLGRIDG